MTTTTTTTTASPLNTQADHAVGGVEGHQAPARLPRISIEFCTQCKWMLRAAYFAQELLSTFSTSIGEVALIPSIGGVFIVDITYAPLLPTESQEAFPTARSDDRLLSTQTIRLWDRKANGGFPETKTIKQLVRNIIDPDRDLGHVDRHKEQESQTPFAS